MNNRLLAMFYADMVNEGYRERDIALKLGVSPSSLSRRINRLFEQGLLHQYYNVLLDKLRSPTWIYVFRMYQRTGFEKCISAPTPSVAYYSPIPSPTYILYYIGYPTQPIDENALNNEVCRMEISGVVEKVHIPYENYTLKNIELRDPVDDAYRVDDYDETISRYMFWYMNPPEPGRYVFNYLSSMLSEYSTPSSFKNHFYRHVLGKIVYKRLIYREPSTYSIIISYAESKNFLYKLVKKLYSNNILVGVDQVNVVSTEPYVVLIHGWVNVENMWETGNVHEYLKYMTYNIYIVKKIAYY